MSFITRPFQQGNHVFFEKSQALFLPLSFSSLPGFSHSRKGDPSQYRADDFEKHRGRPFHKESGL